MGDGGHRGHPAGMGKRILVIDAHPDRDAGRFVHALAAAYIDGARAAGHTVRRIDLATIALPCLRSAAEWRAPPAAPVAEAQQAIGWADHIVILYPLWLGDMPALLKAFLEQVLRPGFAIDETAPPLKAGLLRGRSARIVVTMGMPALFYRLYFRAHTLRSLRRNILGLVGIRRVATTLLGSVDGSPRRREAYLERVHRMGAGAR